MSAFLMPYITWQLILAVVIAFGAGFVWYSDAVFGKKWRDQQPHRKEDDYTGMGEMLIASAVSLILSTIIIIIVIDSFGSDGFTVLLFSVLAGMYAGNKADGGSRKKWCIDGGYVAFQYLVIFAGLYAAAAA